MPGLRQNGHADRAAPVQPDVQDVHGARRGQRQRGLPAAGDGAGDLRQLPERAAVRAAEGAVRHRPDRQGVPQRDHAGQLHLPHARVRADGDAVLRRAGHGRRVVRALAGASAWRGTSALGLDARAGCASTSTEPTSWRTTPRPPFDIEFDFGGRSAARRSRASTTAPTSTSRRHQEFSGKKLEYFDQANNKRYLPYIVETSAGADRVTLAVLVNAYREEEVEGETARGARAHAVARADQGRHLPAGEEGRDARDAPIAIHDDLRRAVSRASTTSRAPSAGATAGRTRRARRSASPSTGRATGDGTVTVRDRDTMQQERVAGRSAALVHGRAAGHRLTCPVVRRWAEMTTGVRAARGADSGADR